MSTTERFASVAAHFSAESNYWADAYGRRDVTSRIYQQRLALTLQWVDDLKLATGARALDLGAGAGAATIALAQRGLVVDAVDGSLAMLARIRESVIARGMARVHPATCDAAALPFTDARFEVVVALGLLPWVHSARDVLAEMARVLRPGGFGIVSTANRARLTYRLDPLYNQDLARLKRPVRAAIERLGVWRTTGPEPRLHSLGETDRMLAAAGFEPLKGITFGFGPLTLLGRPMLSDRAAIALDARLQAAKVLGRYGSEYLVLARVLPR